MLKLSGIRPLFISITVVIWLRLFLTLVGFNISIHLSKFPAVSNQMDLLELLPVNNNSIWYHLAGPFHRFDGLWYQYIAYSNYYGDVHKFAFFPLYPWILRIICNLFNIQFYIAAYFVNTVFTTLAVYLFFKVIRLDYPADTAVRSLFYYITFPAFFFFLCPYADVLLSVFLLSAVLSARKRYYYIASTFGIMGAITKPYGFVIIIPIAGIILLQEKKDRLFKLLFSLLIPLGAFFVMLYQNTPVGTAKNGIVDFPTWKRLTWPSVQIFKAILIFIRNPFDIPNDINMAVVVLITWFLKSTYTTIHKYEWIFTLTFFIIILILADKPVPLMSFSRFLLFLYPIFIFLARLKTSEIIRYVYFISSAVLMTYFFLSYTLGLFVA